ncbi:pyridoxamine 5'-phosphate oxidase family protein [Stenotrophomonas sp.]|uniref:pyridoxamine 5'-phosphate oxidase family protein n=1 Tax=Stenotrophomonas sp. TaxID=69392 RepID=UPI0028AF4F6B|nr:pyridoxamine 5'-phosphate oxidase family protein [Stenotrophomonas sp.]
MAIPVAFSERIDALLAEFHVLSLAACDGTSHWAAPLFYVFDPNNARLVLVTDPGTEHGGLMVRNTGVVVTIAGGGSEIGQLRGLQMRGQATRLPQARIDGGAVLYQQRFKVPVALSPVYWQFVPEFIKATDNRVRFGYKERWPR